MEVARGEFERLAGFERASAGSIVVSGVELGSLSERRLADYRARTLGYADQHYWRALAGELTAEKLIAVPLGLRGTREPERLARLKQMFRFGGKLERQPAPPARERP